MGLQREQHLTLMRLAYGWAFDENCRRRGRLRLLRTRQLGHGCSRHHAA
jgi:hypothetical protein